MSSFLGNQSPPPPNEESRIVNDGWWPNIDPDTVRQTARLDGTVTPARLRQAIVMAVADCNAELALWQLAQQTAGTATAADLTGPSVAGKPAALAYYQQAIISHVQAGLAERNRDVDTTGAGDKKAAELESTADLHRRNLRWAISSITGRPRTTVELI